MARSLAMARPEIYVVTATAQYLLAWNQFISVDRVLVKLLGWSTSPGRAVRHLHARGSTCSSHDCEILRPKLIAGNGGCLVSIKYVESSSIISYLAAPRSPRCLVLFFQPAHFEVLRYSLNRTSTLAQEVVLIADDDESWQKTFLLIPWPSGQCPTIFRSTGDQSMQLGHSSLPNQTQYVFYAFATRAW